MPELNIHRSAVALFLEQGEVIVRKKCRKERKSNMRNEAKGQLELLINHLIDICFS